MSGNECTEDEMITHDFGCCTTFASSFKEQTADGIVGMIFQQFHRGAETKHDLLMRMSFRFAWDHRDIWTLRI